MNRNTIIIIGMLTLLASLFGCREAKKRQAPRGEGLIIPATPVKDYPGGGMGSVYALLATLEAEHLSRGDSVNLSAPYLVRCWLKEQALSAYFSGQSLPEHLSCPVPVGIHLLSTYGLYPYDSYPERDGYQQSVTVRKLQSVIEGARKRPTTLSQLSRRIDDVLDRAMGYLPADRVHFLGADYTPGEFARSVCSPDEYLRLVSFPSLPFGELHANSPACSYPLGLGQMVTLNLPLDSLTHHLRKAVESGHAVCWEGDTTNAAFRHGRAGWVEPLSPSAKEASLRQLSFERLSLTLDHAFAIVGLTHRDGEIYYRCKNSQGVAWGEGGYVYLSESYVRRYTFALTMNHVAYQGEPW